ncbi:ABC transporter, ATP-binding protein [Bacteriovorax sp. BSW11_IV]|uniref:ABC transporter ATP-binding protein n=1 Tax=Bacteriovorax sp. BSW11_IV TaxID=1353529 RepID=UPI000389DD9A|nr:ABC transporter ATP-binding protein [Bacteriovorax sp. BSW11_IV]EQC42932.1 ABC transporter, ATP-binding protein [Bacteriovorax sp. BSW11_IV]
MIIEAVGIERKYKQGQNIIEVLRGLDLAVERGESIAILGKSGSGKSTLLSLLCGIDRADFGQIFYDGTEITHLSENKITELRSKKIGVIFQQFHLIEHLSALENVMLPLEINNVEAAEEKAIEALKKVGIDQRASHFPSELSGGEKQRVAIARSIVNTPNVLLADEPSGSLDEKTGDEVMGLIFDLVKNTDMALILVTHNQELAHKCDRILILENGTLHDLENNS